MVICFLHQEDYLLQAQLNALEKTDSPDTEQLFFSDLRLFPCLSKVTEKAVCSLKLI